MSTTVLIVGGIVIVVIIMTIAIFVNSTQVVPQEKRLAIRRFGRFNRVAGPGPVTVIPMLEQVDRVIEVRSHPVEITVPGIFAFGFPNDLTLNFWHRFDPVQATGGNRDKLADFLQITEGERNHQVEVKIREALVSQVADLQKQMPLPDNAPALAGLFALAPGSSRYHKFLTGVTQQLKNSLPSLGIILDTTHPIVLTKRGVSDEIVEAIKRRRGREIDSEWLTSYADKLRKQFPEMSESILAQMLTSIEGVDAGKVQSLHLEGEAGAETEVEFEMAKDGLKPHLIAKPRLTKSDFAVLKRVPRSD